MRSAALLLVLISLLPAFAASAPAPIVVGGQVTGPGGAPVAGARVRLVPFGSLAASSRLELDGTTDAEPVASVSTSPEGGFRLEAPETGMWKVVVEARDLVPKELLLGPLVAETELPPVKLERDAKLEVRVAGPDGRPRSGVRVRVTTADLEEVDDELYRRVWRVPARMARTDSKGMAVLPRESGEKLLVQAGADGQPAAGRTEVAGGSVSLRLTTGTTRQIRVFDATGRKPVPGVFVRAGKRRWCAGRTSEDGLFAVPLLPGRREEVALLAEDGRQLAAWVEPAKGDEKGPRVMYLPALETLAGRVVSALDDRPIPGALVWSFDPGGFRRTGVDGGYRLELAPSPDPSWLVAAAPGFLPLAVQAEGRRGPTVALKPALAAGGVVVDEGGRRVAGVTITALPDWGSLARTASDGRFRLSALEAGRGHVLRLSKPGFAVGLFQLPPLEAGSPAPDLRIVLHRGRAGFGRIVDQARQPVSGADVVLRTSGDLRMTWTYQDLPHYRTASGADGRFEIRDLPAGTYELTVQGRGHAPLSVPGLTVPAGAGSTDLGTVVLRPGAPVEGWVVDPEGKPIPGAEVTLAEAGLDMGIRPGQEAPSAVSGPDGFFRFEDRRVGETVDLSARHASYAPALAPGVRVPPEPAVRIVLQPVAALEGKTVDSADRPVPGARLAVRPSHYTSPWMETVSDESGFFRIESVMPGSVELRAGAPGYQSALLKLDLRPGQDLQGVEVLLVPGATVEGRILSAAGKPVVGAYVFMAGVSSSFPTSDGEGRYRLEGVPPGTRTIMVRHQDRYVRRQVDVRMGENTFDLTLDQPADVNGRVVVDQEGAPVANAWVRLRETSKNQDSGSATSRLDGSFTISGVGDGTYSLIAWKEGFAGSLEEPVVTVAGGSVDGIEVRLTPGGTIAGRLLGLDFPDLSRVQVWTDVELQTGQVRPDGSYRIDHVLPGRRRVFAALPGGLRQAEGEVVVEAGASEARLDLEFAKGVVLTGRVLRNGEPIRRAVLLAEEAKDNEEPASRGGETDLAGRFRFEGLDPGRYRLEISGPEPEGNYRKTLMLSADLDLLIELPTGSIAGRVVDAVSREPIAHAQVALLPPGGASADGFVPAGTRTDSRGVFQLRGLAEGTWTVRAVLEGYAPAEVVVQMTADAPAEGVEIVLQAETADAPR